MIKKLLIIHLFFLLNGCGYQPIFINNDPINIKFHKITLIGDIKINKRIINKIKIAEDNISKGQNEFFLSSGYAVQETSKNSEGIIETYRSNLLADVKIIINGKVIKEKNISKNFNYNKKANKFELVKYQNSIKNILIDQVSQDIILFLKTQ